MNLHQKAGDLRTVKLELIDAVHSKNINVDNAASFSVVQTSYEVIMHSKIVWKQKSDWKLLGILDHGAKRTAVHPRLSQRQDSNFAVLVPSCEKQQPARRQADL